MLTVDPPLIVSPRSRMWTLCHSNQMTREIYCFKHFRHALLSQTNKNISLIREENHFIGTSVKFSIISDMLPDIQNPLSLYFLRYQIVPMRGSCVGNIIKNPSIIYSTCMVKVVLNERHDITVKIS